MEPIEFMLASNIVTSRGRAVLGESLLGIAGGSNRVLLCISISCQLNCLLLIANFLISLIWACSCAFCQFLSSLAYSFCSTSLTFYNQVLRSRLGLLLLMSH